MASIWEGPHYEIPSTELAIWLEQAGPASWWNVDGDPLLTGRVSFPCPTDELAPELRKIARPLLVQAHDDDPDANGQVIGADQISRVVDTFGSNLQTSGLPSDWANNQVFYFCWKGSPHEWMLAEDRVTAKQFEADQIPLPN